MASYTFSNANGGYWENAANWTSSASGVPGIGDDASDVGLPLFVDVNEAANTLALSSAAILDIYGGTLTIGTTLTVDATSGLDLYAGALYLDGRQSSSNNATVTFEGAGKLSLDTSAGNQFGALTLLDFAASGGIDLVDLGAAQNVTATLNGTTLDINYGAGSMIDVTLDSSVLGKSFQVASDGNGGTLVTVACFCRGTAIATPEGEIAVEELQVGDMVLTEAGPEAVRWIGTRSYAGRFMARSPATDPIRIAAGALGGGLPRRDLFVSPQHAMLLDGVLVAASDLADGHGVARQRGWQRVDYFHIELDRHAILFAEGAATESFIDHDSAGLFSNAHHRPEREGLACEEDCAPRVVDGHTLQAIRDRLARQPHAA